jgi:hypothetical protein
MSKKVSTGNPTKKRRLQPVLLPGMASGWKKLHPIVPVIIGLLLTGTGRHMRMTLWGLFACAVWLCVDLAPYADWWGKWGANKKFPMYLSHFGGYGKSEAEQNRKDFQRGFFSITFAMLAFLVLFGFARVANLVIEDHVDDEQNDAKAHLDAITSVAMLNSQLPITARRISNLKS